MTLAERAALEGRVSGFGQRPDGSKCRAQRRAGQLVVEGRRGEQAGNHHQGFERLAIDVLKECDVEGAARLLRLSWDEAWHLMDRAVARGRARKPHVVPAKVGVDEKAAGRGQDYITVVSNLETGCVEYLADERRQASLDGFFAQFSAEEREGIAAVAMDMWDPYITSTREHLSEADRKIVFDRYHLMKYLTTAADTVRKQENRALVARPSGYGAPAHHQSAPAPCRRFL